MGNYLSALKIKWKSACEIKVGALRTKVFVANPCEDNANENGQS